MSAVLVAYNEGRHLKVCLESLSACAEIIVVDLGSSDNSVAVARRYTTKVLSANWVPYAPMIREHGIRETTNDWVVSLDPDMVLPKETFPRALELIQRNPEVALIYMSYENYFAGRRLRYGRWGGLRPYFPIIVHKERVEVETVEHRGHFRIKPGYSAISLPPNGNCVIRHNWVDSLDNLRKKHDRYLPGEIRARSQESSAPSRGNSVRNAILTLMKDLLWHKGILEGVLGIRLASENLRYEWNVERGMARTSKSENR